MRADELPNTIAEINAAEQGRKARRSWVRWQRVDDALTRFVKWWARWNFPGTRL